MRVGKSKINFWRPKKQHAELQTIPFLYSQKRERHGNHRYTTVRERSSQDMALESFRWPYAWVKGMKPKRNCQYP